MKKIINYVVVLSLMLGCFLATQNVETEAKMMGKGSFYKYNAPNFNLGDEIYCESDDEFFYKLYVPSDTYIRVYARGYDPRMHIYFSLYDSNGNCEEFLYSDSSEKWGYEQLDRIIYLRKGTYIIGVEGYGWTEYSDYLYVKVSKTTVRPKSTIVSNVKKSSNNYSSKFKVSRKNIYVKKGRKKKITVTFKYSSGSVYYKVKNTRKVSASWGSWYGDKVKLRIKGKRRGKTKVIISNSKTRKKYAINVWVY